VSKYAHDSGFYINAPKRKRGREEKPEGFQGAHCFEVKQGIHTDLILGLDFASLYPSVIRRYNIDPSTLVLAPTKHPTMKRQLTDGKDEYAEFVPDVEQAPIPRLLEELGKSRTTVKKQMKSAVGIEYDVLNQRQLAIKVTINSCYGFLGASTGPIGHPELTAAVTAYGRDLVRDTAQYMCSLPIQGQSLLEEIQIVFIVLYQLRRH
jgi:DNA polymerase delta subunit 1